MWAVGKFFIMGGLVDFEGYVKVFKDFHKAMEYAFEQTVIGGESEYFHVERMSEEMVRAGGIEDLIES